MISKVLFQWDALRLHFELARTQDRCFTADLLWRMFSDPVNKVYLTFLCNELQAICRVNKAFQAENADITKLHGDLNDYFISLIQKIVPPSNLKNVSLKNLSDFDFTTSLMPPSAIHLGHSVHLLMDSFKMSPDTIEAIKSVCFKFLVELATQIKNRLPDNFSVLRDLDLLSPRNATSQMTKKQNGCQDIKCHFTGRNLIYELRCIISIIFSFENFQPLPKFTLLLYQKANFVYIVGCRGVDS